MIAPNVSRIIRALLLCAFALAGAGCNTTDGPEPGSLVDAQAAYAGTDTAPPATLTRDQSTSSEAQSGSSGDYKIGPRDQLQITVFQVPDLNRSVQVDNTGYITLPLINSVKVSGLTIRQAQDEITSRLAKSYLRSPQVTLALAKSGQRVVISGGGAKSSVLTVDGELTLSQAIAQSGGLTETGNPERVHVARSTNGRVDDQIYNLNEIQSGRSSDPALRGGDIVVVEESSARMAFKTVKDLVPFAGIAALAASDVRLKKDIRHLYDTVEGIPVYRFKYRWSDTVYVGVLAQDIQRIVPDAVQTGTDGYLRVNYARLGFEMQPCKVWMAMRSGQQTGLNCW